MNDNSDGYFSDSDDESHDSDFVEFENMLSSNTFDRDRIKKSFQSLKRRLSSKYIETKKKKKLENEVKLIHAKKVVKKAQPLNCSLKQFLDLLEKMLCFNALYRSSFNFVGKSQIDKDEFQQNVRKMMLMITKYVPRNKGNVWNLQKFHEILHLAKHIDDYGSPLNFDAGTGERGLKVWVKNL